MVRDLASGTTRKLTPEPGHYADPVFTPDGGELVYQKRGGGYVTSPLWSRDPGIYRISVSGGEPALVSKEGTNPQFGGDGKRVFLMKVSE